jgi:tRNA/tmRNA/rRNA uracil-C5-methylase (TrmA/RlmC/RlmD family)
LINRILEYLIPAMERQIHVARAVKRIEIAVSPDEGQGHVIFDVMAHCNEKRLKIMAEEVIAGAGFIKDALVQYRAFSQPRSLVGNEGMKSALRFHVGSSSLFCSPGAFFQVNDEQNNRLVRTVKEEIGRQEWESVLELFSGVGNFSIPLSGFAKTWTGIEQEGVAVKNASYNAQLGGVKNLRFLRGAALKVLQKLRKEERSCDLLFLDPPREGALEELRVAVSFNPRKIVYVSCNPATLARDLRFLATAGFKPTRILPFDFFPQTFHIESVTFLSPTPSLHN